MPYARKSTQYATAPYSPLYGGVQFFHQTIYLGV